MIVTGRAELAQIRSALTYLVYRRQREINPGLMSYSYQVQAELEFEKKVVT